MLFNGILNRGGVKIFGEYKGSCKEAEPQIHSDEAEYVAEGKQNELLQISVVVALNAGTGLYDIDAVFDLIVKIFSRIGAKFDIFSCAGRHEYDTTTKIVRGIQGMFGGEYSLG